MADLTQLGQVGLSGWRAKVGDAVAEPVAQRTPLGDEQVRALVGAAFFVLAVVYVAKTVRQLAQQARG